MSRSNTQESSSRVSEKYRRFRTPLKLKQCCLQTGGYSPYWIQPKLLVVGSTHFCAANGPWCGEGRIIPCMILRTNSKSRVDTSKYKPAWDAFQKSQDLKQDVTEVISQPAHASLSGQLASRLLPSVFGAFPAQVSKIIGSHDCGWSASDLTDLELHPRATPQSFLDKAPEEAVIAWRRSIRMAEAASSLAGVLVSRHFCLIATPDSPTHIRFIEEETRRREDAERRSEMSQSELEIFTSVLGFCDLVSLYLCSGYRGRVWLPLCHPADSSAGGAERVLAENMPAGIRFEPACFEPGSNVEVAAWKIDGANRLTTSVLSWEID
jgi:hypothetical protein